MVKRKRIVVTGMGVLTALGSTIEEFKAGLLTEQASIRPSVRFSKSFDHALASEVLQHIDYVGIPSDLMPNLDRTVLWGYKCGRDALEQAGLLEHPILEKATLIVGVSSAGSEAIEPLLENRPDDFNPGMLAVSGEFSSICPVVTSLLGIRGGFDLVATACTASTNAIGMAYDQIQNNKSSAALVIGSDPIYLPTFAGFYALKAMREEPCSPFSGTPGLSIGEGAGALVLEEYESAVARGATIFGEIISYATSSDAHHETAPDPRGEGAAQVMRRAMQNANVTAKDIDYINAHGTGTEANDRAETTAMKKVFDNIAQIPVSSSKSYFGHNIGSAGIVEMIACLVTLPEQKILPTLNFSEPRTGCDLNYVPNTFQSGDVGLFMKNNYAFGGNNCSVIASIKPEVTPQTSYDPKTVVISSMGAISSLGYGVDTIYDRIQACESGAQAVSFQELFSDAANVESNRQQLFMNNPKVAERLSSLSPEQLAKTYFNAHPVTGIEPRKHLKNYDPRKASKIATYGLLALEQALQKSAKKVRHGDTDVAMIWGISKGPQATQARYAASLYPDPRRARTFEFPSALMNSTATFCAIAKGMKGYNTTVSTGFNSGFSALAYGYELVRQGLQPQALVGGADEISYSNSLLSINSGRLDWSGNDNSPQVYAADSEGYLLAEGSAVLMLEDANSASERGAEALATVLGYGKSCDSIIPGQAINHSVNAMSAAIKQALLEANININEIDLVCGSAWAQEAAENKELGAIRELFGQDAKVPVVNYNGYFGFVESAAALLNLSVVLETMKRGVILPIANTPNFRDDSLAFVLEPLHKQVRTALVLGASEGGNNYALIVRKVA